MKTTIILIIFFIFCSCSRNSILISDVAKDPYSECFDFLTKWNLSHPQIIYQSCTKEPKTLAQPKIIAIYNVSGKDAKEIEKYLGEKFGMMPLVFICCGWTPRVYSTDKKVLQNLGKGIFFDHQYLNPFNIQLISEGTVEKDWNKISFKLYIETNYTEI